MKDLFDGYYTHPKRVCKEFETKNVGGHHDLYIQSDTLLLAGKFENFQNMFLQVYKVNPVRCIAALELAWQAGLKNTKIKLKLLTDVNILLMVENEIRGICYSCYSSICKR